MADSEAQPNHATDNTNPSKYYNHFFFKAIIVTIFLVLLPLFPSQSPEPINQTRTWEILQLIFVGIAVSYGLFSKKSDEISLDKENGSSPTSPSKFDNAQSYVSRLLHVSSVFDDESEDSSVFSDDNNSNSNSNSNKVFQTWNNQYHRGETKSHILEENLKSISVKTSKVGEKPLLLPVRSLKSRVAEADLLEETSNNKPDPKRFSGKLMEEKVAENLVLPSPIPWRSRSGRMEIKEESPLFSSSSKTEDSVFRSQSFRSYSSPSGAPGFSSPRKKTPAPPPPPPHFFGKSSSMKTMLIANKSNDSSLEKELRRSIKSVPTEIPHEEGQKEGPFAGKSRTFTPFNGRGRSYAIEKAKEENQENLGRKERGLGTEETEDSDMEDEDDFFDENAEMEGTNNHSIVGDDNSGGDGGPDVDKKADEFIAKFREQIRLQRIESIRRSAGQASARNQLVR